jgi:ABC-type uncharacterized transport system auxiliary subunit
MVSAVLAALLLGLWGCGNKYEPVAVSKCSKVVKHARKLMGNKADSVSKMTTQCKAASDQERGCVMVADSKADLMRCSM